VTTLLEDITKFHSVACATATAAEAPTTEATAPTTTPTTSSVSGEEVDATTTETTSEGKVFRGQSVETLLGAIKKFDEAACGRTGQAAEQSGTGTRPTRTDVPVDVEQTDALYPTYGGVDRPKVTDEMINEFIVNKRCV
jgi:hypothetical protein